MNTNNPYLSPQVDATTNDNFQLNIVSYAKFWQRFVAAFIDGIITGVMGAIGGFIIGLVVGLLGGGAEAGGLAGQFIGLIIGWLYGALLESSNKQATLGKQMMKIRVSDESGERVSFGRASGRHFAKIISTLILLIGYFMMLFTNKKQTLHDKMSGCIVTQYNG